jgi:hypothetical protein
MVGNDQQISSYRNSCWKSRADYSEGLAHRSPSIPYSADLFSRIRAHPINRIADLPPCNWSQVFDQSLAA